MSMKVSAYIHTYIHTYISITREKDLVSKMEQLRSENTYMHTYIHTYISINREKDLVSKMEQLRSENIAAQEQFQNDLQEKEASFKRKLEQEKSLQAQVCVYHVHMVCMCVCVCIFTCLDTVCYVCLWVWRRASRPRCVFIMCVYVCVQREKNLYYTSFKTMNHHR